VSSIWVWGGCTASKTEILTPSVSEGEGGKRERSSSISLGVGVAFSWRTSPSSAERELRGEGVISGSPSSPIRSMRGLGSLSDLSALRSWALSPNVTVLWSDDREEYVMVGGCRRIGDVSSIIWDGDEGGARWAVARKDVLLPEGSGDLTPDAERSVAMAGGGGTNSGGVELPIADVGLDPVELISSAVDSRGVRVAIDVLEKSVSGVMLHWGVSSSCRVLILLLLRP